MNIQESMILLIWIKIYEKVLKRKWRKLPENQNRKVVSSPDRSDEYGRKPTKLPLTTFIVVDDFRLLCNHRKCVWKWSGKISKISFVSFLILWFLLFDVWYIISHSGLKHYNIRDFLGLRLMFQREGFLYPLLSLHPAPLPRPPLMRWWGGTILIINCYV